ncbi:MAG: caspase family protein [Streptomyces sp.]|nr:caspase family protein [Streptomyces sp.]
MREGSGRRYLIAVGVGKFRDSGYEELPGAAEDVQRVRELLEPLGYETVLTDLAVDPAKAELAEGIEDWTHDAGLGPDDVVIVYFAGHGVSEEDRRHYLLCTDAKPGRISRALAAEDLARPLVMSQVGHLLVMLDTCYAGVGTKDIGRLSTALADLHRGRANRWHLAAARTTERAKEKFFVDALVEVFRHPQHGSTQRYVSVREVTERINVYLQEHRPRQQARLTTTETDGQDPFFPNELYVSDIPADGIDLASLDVLRRKHDGHFEPRSRGVEHIGERGDYFTGRERAQDALIAYLGTSGAEHDRKARVVTGDPGSGKSALLGRLLSRADEEAHVIALHARRASLADLVSDLAGALQLPAGADRDTVLSALCDRTARVSVVVDSLDEAGTGGDDDRESRLIARELLRPLSSLPCVRLVIGTRRPQIPSLGSAVRVLDLDDPEHITRADVANYARAVLVDAQDPHSRSPYRADPGLAATIAEGIAERAGHSYLVARMTARALVHGQITIDPAVAGWREQLPKDAGEAFSAYLDRFGHERAKVERLLRPLAYAQGAGLPWSTLWAPLAEALSGVPCPQDDLDWLHDKAGAYIIETPTPDGSAYRLFHETMAEQLRREGRESADHATIARALTATVRLDPAANVNDWPAAHPYVRDHVATHAAAGKELERLTEDAEYLVHAEPTGLLRALGTITDPVHRTAADIYRASADRHAQLPAAGRRDVLAVDASRYQRPMLSTNLARTRPWKPRWATGSLVHPAHRATLPGHAGSVNAVAVTDIDGRPHAITAGSDKTVRVWDLTTSTQLPPLTGHTDWVRAVAVAHIDGRPHAITAGDDETVRVWDLTTSTQLPPLTGHTNSLNAVAVTDIDGHPHAITASGDDAVRIWDLTTSTQRPPLTGHTDWVNAVAVTDIDGHPHAITAGNDETVRVWDLTTSTQRPPLTGHTDWVNAVAVTDIDGHPHAITASDDKTVRIWELSPLREAVVVSLPLSVYAITAYKDIIVLGMANEVVVLERA